MDELWGLHHVSVHLGLLVGYKGRLNVRYQLWQIFTLAAECSTIRQNMHALFPADLFHPLITL